MAQNNYQKIKQELTRIRKEVNKNLSDLRLLTETYKEEMDTLVYQPTGDTICSDPSGIVVYFLLDRIAPDFDKQLTKLIKSVPYKSRKKKVIITKPLAKVIIKKEVEPVKKKRGRPSKVKKMPETKISINKKKRR